MLRSKLTLSIIVAITLAVTLRNWEHWAELFGFGGDQAAPISAVSAVGAAEGAPASDGEVLSAGAAPPLPTTPSTANAGVPAPPTAVINTSGASAGSAPSVSGETLGQLEKIVRLLQIEADPGANALPIRPTHSEIELVNQLPFEAVVDWMMLYFRYKTNEGALPTPEAMAAGADQRDFIPESGSAGNSGQEEKRGDAEQALFDAVCTGTLVAKDPALSEARIDGTNFKVGDSWPGTRYAIESISADGVRFVSGRRPPVFKGVQRRR